VTSPPINGPAADPGGAAHHAEVPGAGGGVSSNSMVLRM
jgi:hypothetical protein